MKPLAMILCAALAACAVQPAPSPMKAACVAMRLPPAAAGMSVARLWGQQGNLWPQHATLRVQFLGGTESQRRRAWCRFLTVDKLVNLTFVKAAPGEAAQIRVAFTPGAGHWSYVGRDNLSIAPPHPTMNLSLSEWDSSREWTRVATHEVCHAIGFHHEHQHPQDTTPWNYPAVFADYRRTQGWSEAQTRYQVTDRRSVPDQVGTPAPDRQSLMMYPIPPAHVLDPSFAVGWNRKLSTTDKLTLRRLYP